MEFEYLRDSLKQAIEQAEDYAIAHLRDGLDFQPFISSGDRKIRKIVADSLDRAMGIAYSEIEGMDLETTIFAYKGSVKFADGDVDAIITHVFDEDEEFGYAYGLAYTVDDGEVRLPDRHVFLGNIRNCLIF